MLTLLGPGGIGKTRLAARLAELECGEERWRGGIWWCPLAQVSDVDGVCAVVGEASGARVCEPSALAERLRERGPTLVVLDDCEPIAAKLGTMLAAMRTRAPEVKWLLTSRERMNVAGEEVLVVPPLRTPEAVSLFLERAACVGSLAEPSPDELAAITALVQRLDRVPLAIELAAARASVLSPRELLERLCRRFELLSFGPTDASPRHATLRVAIDASWDLLTAEEQQILRQLSVFHGSFTVDAAERIVIGAGARGRVLRVIESLQNKSLVHVPMRQGHRGARRLALYDSIRDYALERLESAGVRAVTVAKHRHHFATWAAAREEARFDGDPDAGAELVDEHDNLLAAHGEALEAASKDREAMGDALMLAVALHQPMLERQSIRAYAALLDRTLAHRAAARASPKLLAPVHRERAGLRMLEQTPDGAEEARRDYDRALRLTHQARDRVGEAAVLMHSALYVWLDGELGDWDEARSRLDRASGIFDAHALPVRAATARVWLSQLEMQLGNLDVASRHATRAVHGLSNHGARVWHGIALTQLGEVEHLCGDLAGARRHYERALALLESTNRRARAVVMGVDAVLSLETLELDRARASAELAANAFRDLGSATLHAKHVAIAGAVAAARDAIDVAERLLESAREIVEHTSSLAAVTAAVTTLCQGYLDLARARRAEREGDVATTAALLGRAREKLENVDTMPRDELVLLLERALRTAIATHGRQAAATTGSLLVERHGDWFQVPGGRRVSCGRKRVVRELLCALATRRKERPGQPLSVAELVRAAWSDEKLDHKTAQNRLHGALNSLRKLGLRAHLMAAGRGYMLDPRVPCDVIE